MNRLSLTRQSPQHIEHYAEQTRRVVDDLASQLQVLFEDERAGRMSPTWARTLDRLFDLWCEQSGIVSPSTARAVLQAVDPLSLPEVLKAVRVDLGFSSDEVTQACEEYVARARAGREPSRLLRRLEQQLYRAQIRSLCIQSAHVTLARVVLYRVLEDRGIAQPRISGATLLSAMEAQSRGLIGAPSVFELLEEMRAGSEDFLPSLYQRRELDWWLIDFPRGSSKQALFDQRMGAVEVELARMLQVLDGYDFAGVDQDVWRDVYEHHLPWEERQRLGSFYTPDAVVRIVLDLTGWTDAESTIADSTVADISCGSGAFLVEALRRRRTALERARRLPGDPTPEQLDHLVAGVVGLDIHPFATFLASVNLLFQVIDLYESVRRRHRDYSVPLNVFTVDSLEDAGAHPRLAKLREDIPEDIRIRHTEDEIARYRELRTRRFDVVVGNPPWGGVLKGRLSPLNDPMKRREYAAGRFASATGKYDIFVLFVERSIRWLRDGGHYGFVVPSAYRDRSFGQGLREFLVEEGAPTDVVDLLPFGELLFRAMNTPTLLAGTRHRATSPLRVVSVGADLPFAAAVAQRELRQAELGSAVNAALNGRSTTGVTVYTEPAGVVNGWGRQPWPLAPERHLREAVERSGSTSVWELFEPSQGVTPGGEGVLDVLQLPPDVAAELGLESQLIHPVAKGLELQAGAAAPGDSVLLYPYLVTETGGRRAFNVDANGATWDALDPEPHGSAEARLVGGLRERDRHRRLVERRIAEGICPYPAIADYLVRHYDLLASRRPEGKPITQAGKRWWEYHRSRDPVAMLATPKLLGPRRGMKWPRFALDERGLLPTDPVVAFGVPGSLGARTLLRQTRDALGRQLRRPASARDMLLYVMAFLNAAPSAAVLRIGRLPTAKGGWTVDESYLRSVRIAVPEDSGLVSDICRAADAVVRRTRDGRSAHANLEQLDALVPRALDLAEDVRKELNVWADATRQSTA
jgi:hypothetical protein